MLASSIKSDILRALAGGPKGLKELGRDLGSPIELPGRNPDTLAKITPSGREMLFVASVLERWLDRTPKGVLPFGGDGATEAIEALAKSWSSTLLHVLSERPHSLAELDHKVQVEGYASTERCLEAMRLLGQVETVSGGDSEGALYGLTDWMREGVSPLAAAARLEQRHRPDQSPSVAPADVEAAFLLAVPLLRLADEFSGSCRLAIRLVADGEDREAGVTVEVEEGQIVSCVSDLGGDHDSTVEGDLRAWFDAVIDGNPNRLAFAGDHSLALELVGELHEVLFGAE
jgi:DNA-binding HxlR family transcriptional regulator